MRRSVDGACSSVRHMDQRVAYGITEFEPPVRMLAAEIGITVPCPNSPERAGSSLRSPRRNEIPSAFVSLHLVGFIRRRAWRAGAAAQKNCTHRLSCGGV